MKTPSIPPDEPSRLASLHSLDILDTLPEDRFDRLTRLAKRLFGVPIALVSLVDANRQWFKSCQGLSVSETSREVSFCGHTILSDRVLLVPDALADERFQDNPLVTDAPNIRFYAGCPLSLPNGARLGTLCLIDRVPRALDADALTALSDLARLAEQELASVQLATTDELTQICNRRGFNTLSAHALSMCKRFGKRASFVYFDLDRFKQINDQLGHAVGDRALVAFAELLRSTFRESDVIARLGGDEFAVLTTDAGPAESGVALARLRTALAAKNLERTEPFELGCSAGIATFDAARHLDLDAFITDADERMLEAKRAARATRAVAERIQAA